MRSGVVVSIGALLLLAPSCTTHKAVLDNSTVNSEQVHDAVRANQLRMQSAQGEGTISVETPTLAQSGSFSLTWKRPDSLLVNLRGPFGIKVGSALVTRSTFQFYNSLQNRVYSGETNPQNLSRILHVDVSFDDLMNLFTGGVFLDPDGGNPDELSSEDDQYTMVYKGPDVAHKYYVDPSTHLITKIEYLDGGGKLQFEQQFVNYQMVDSVLVPFTIRIIQPKERRMVSVVYSDLTLNGQNLPFSFSVPRSAQQIRWQ